MVRPPISPTHATAPLCASASHWWQNLNLRMGVRRFTRLTNAFSKKFENHCHMVAIYHAYYNFCRVHQTLRVTPAMEAGIRDHVWSLEELVALLDRKEAQAAA